MCAHLTQVDDEDRDFRRSRRGGGVSGGRLKNDSVPTRRVVSIVTSSTGAGGGPSTGISRKRRIETNHDNEGTNRLLAFVCLVCIEGMTFIILYSWLLCNPKLMSFKCMRIVFLYFIVTV